LKLLKPFKQLKSLNFKHIKHLNVKPFVLIGIVIATVSLYFVFFYDPIQDIPPEFENIGLQIEPLVFDGQRIHFSYTDENEGESIIIKSNKKVYEGGDRSDVYFSLTNTGDKSEKIAILKYFPKEYGDLSYVDVWNGDSWQGLPLVRGDIKGNMTKLGKAFEKKKPVPDKFDVKAGIQFEIAAGHTAYFKAEINYPSDKEGEFWFEAFGDQGGYGLLDPLFVGGGTIIGQTTTSRDTPSGWYNTGGTWDYRRKITIDKSRVSGTSNLANFPVLVSVTYPDLRTTGFSGKLASGSGEFVFTSSDGTTVLPHEIERYSSSSGEFIGWVNVTTLSVSQDTAIYVYYGGPSSGATNQNKTGVWDANYKGVWHLPNGTTLSVADSTSNAQNGTNHSATATTGQIDGGAGLASASSQYIDASTGIPFTKTSAITAEAWVKTSGATGSIITNWNVSTNPGWELLFASGYIYMGTVNAAGSAGYIKRTTNTYNDNAWHHVVGTYAGTDASGVTIYVDGSAVALTNVLNTDPGTLVDNSTLIGKRADGIYQNGIIDEARLSNTARSADWIATEYNNQFKPSLFYLVGGLESRTAQTVKIGQTTTSRDTPSGWYNTGGTWDYRRKITIDKSRVSGTSNLANFPVLVSVTYPDLRTTGFSGKLASGSGEFVFTSSDGTTVLPHEIERYSSSSGEFIGWVTTLSVSQDTAIYVYYGGPSSGATNQNKTGTWDSNYKGVWHLPNGTTLGLKDSTSNATNGTNNSGTAVTGKIDGALNLNGSSQYVAMGNVISIGTNDVTAEAWIKPANANQIAPVFSKRDNGAGGFLQYDIGIGSVNSSGTPTTGKTFYWFIYTGVLQSYHTTNNYADGTWHHVVWIRTSGVISIYVDGVSVALTADSANTTALNPDNDDSFNIGYDNGTRYLTSPVDEGRMSVGIARSADWIKTEYTNQFKPSLFYLIGGLEKQN